MREGDPKSTFQALAFELWRKVPMPMVPLMKTLDVMALVRLSRKRGNKFKYAPLLVYRKGGSPDGGLLSASGGRQADPVRPAGRQYGGGHQGWRHFWSGYSGKFVNFEISSWQHRMGDFLCAAYVQEFACRKPFRSICTVMATITA